ncbi:CheY-like chemotaxis protein [Catalinimonas alkaloidigena]|uniref:response regulator n=1 Tax=Catalinimonas alkaloidigena TaxID=1075417 RepID=UPI002405F38B|nr:response regulator [Catalinimonas alkaloidigena]MDF9801205.1 CheY-like chemotaxis protein [Catalinimonas alkaloidigena]
MIFMIDDDEDALEIYAMLIEKSGYSDLFVTYSSGVEALEALKELHSEGKKFPRYILLDLNMPELGGVDFVEKYEELYYPQYAQTEIVILTSSVREKDNEEALQYDAVSRFISKPLSKERLVEMLSESASKS